MRATIFDIDGTLIHSAKADDMIYRDSVISVLGPVRFRDSPHDYDRVTDDGILLQIVEDNDIEHSAKLVATIKKDFFERMQRHVLSNGPFNEVPGAKKFLRYLSDSATCRIAIATGGWRMTAEFKLETAGFDLSGIPLVSSDDGLDRSDIMELALSRIDPQQNVALDSVSYFGDGEWDRAACAKLGWEFRAVGTALGGLDDYHGLITPISIETTNDDFS